MDLLSDLWNLWLLVDEPIGIVLGLVAVWFLIRETSRGSSVRPWGWSRPGLLETHARAVWQDCCSIQIG